MRLAEVAHIHIGYCKITTCYRARPDKRAQRCSVSSYPAVWMDVSYAETIITPPCGRMSQRMRHAKNCLRTRAFFRIRALLALAFSLSLLATQAAGHTERSITTGGITCMYFCGHSAARAVSVATAAIIKTK